MNSDDDNMGYVVYRWGFPCLDYPLMYHSREFIIWACTISFGHTCIYRMFNVFIACLIYLSHIFMYLCSRHHFLCMFFDSDLSIYMYLLDFGFLVLWSLLYYTCSHPAFSLLFYSTCLLLLSYCTMCSPAQYHLVYIYLLLYAYAHDTVFNVYL